MACGGLCLALVGRLAAQGNGSLSDLDIEFSEVKLTLENTLEENRKLRSQLNESEKTAASIRENLAAVNGEAEVFRRQASELKLRMEALGLATAGGNTGKVEQRLLRAAADLQGLDAEKKRLSEALIRLTEAIVRFSKVATTTDGDARMSLEAELRGANEALGVSSPGAVEATAVPWSLTDGKVISVKEDLALVVTNVGSKSGVRIGMPFQVLRGEQRIGTVRVVDVRDKIAGAVIQNLISEKERVKVGDDLKVDAQH
jgi:hypothetical protein